MYTATVQLAITRFVPMLGIIGKSPCTKAKMLPPVNTSPQPQTPVFSGNGKSLKVRVPKGYDGAVVITYQLPDPNYVMVGIAYEPIKGGVGRHEFRSVGISRDDFGSQMAVTDSCLPDYMKVLYSYVILVQHVATGNIGAIDPEIETDIEK
jgi:hypothetical protein